MAQVIIDYEEYQKLLTLKETAEKPTDLDQIIQEMVKFLVDNRNNLQNLRTDTLIRLPTYDVKVMTGGKVHYQKRTS